MLDRLMVIRARRLMVPGWGRPIVRPAWAYAGACLTWSCSLT